LHCDVVILAAGFSSRMKKWKPALPVGDTTVIQLAAEHARAGGGRVIVVGGERSAELRQLLADGRREEGPSLLLVVNPAPERGMLSSVQTGVQEARTPRYFIALGDMPFVRKETYLRLMRAAAEGPGHAAEVILPRWSGREGHPVLLSAEHTTAVLAADSGRMTPRDVLRPFPKRYVDVDDEGVCIDLDTPGDYRRMCGTDLP
jgi:molybdenum cofactor cytidylyltransferase